MLTLLASARADDVVRVLALVDAAELAEGVVDPRAELCPIVAEQLAAHPAERVARAVARRLAFGDAAGPAPDASGGVTRLLRERFGTEARGRRPVVMAGRGRNILMHPAPDLATARSAFHDYLLPQPWVQPEVTRAAPSYRALLIRGLERGSIDAATLVRDGQPGAAIVELAAHDRTVGPDGRVDRARRARADLAWELRRLVGEELGAQVGRWHRVLTGVQETLQSFGRLAHERVFLRGVDVFSRRGLWDRWVVTNALLSLAPPTVVAQLLRESDDFPYGPSAEHPPSLATINRDDDAVFAVAVAHNAPLPRAVVDFVLTDEPKAEAHRHLRDRQREALASNPATPDSVLRSLLAPGLVTGDLCRRVFQRPDSDEALCTAIFRMAPYPEFDTEWYASMLSARPTPAQLAPLWSATDAEWVHEAVRQAAVRIEGPGLLSCYIRLAELAGLEPVWALELDRVGTLDRMHPAVRASMAAADAAPLITAAQFPPDDAPKPVPGRRTDTVVDDPLAWPLEDAVRATLDGRPERWRAVINALMSGADDPLPDVVAGCAAGL
ncbi:hypothetical protein GCM10009839_50970 [Catenulispora yoronensis]|uniref:Uncharacterized protein n=1 Tax=Catenulispora yoronensis TaxID=450799 RepID=A0ABN2USS0_9ACTN